MARQRESSRLKRWLRTIVPDVVRNRVQAIRRALLPQRIIVLATRASAMVADSGVIELTSDAYSQLLQEPQPRPYPSKPYIAARFRDGYRLLSLWKDGRPVSFAWLVKTPRLYACEVRATLVAVDPETYWVMDCVTLPEHRGHGYYPELLRTVIGMCEGRQVLIYALDSNRASLSGIAKTPFREVAQVIRSPLGVRVKHTQGSRDKVRVGGPPV